MKIATIVGARPQFIKLGPVSRELKKFATEVVIHTGQHYDDNMSEVFFRELDLAEPRHHLGVGGSTLLQQTAAMLTKLETVLIAERPDLVLTYGDTTSTLAGALAAAQLNLPSAHVEAGLRSFNRAMPEENNRVVADALAAILFAPTDAAVANLHREGVAGKVIRTGDVMCDALLHSLPQAEARHTSRQFGREPKTYYLATIHRAANTDDPVNLRHLLEALAAAPRPVILPLHPRTKKLAAQHGLERSLAHPNLTVIEPQGYLDSISLLAGAIKLLTDSGGMQKEAYLLGVPGVTLREETEWVETLVGGWNVLTGADPAKIAAALAAPVPTAPRGECYGRGDAARSIAAALQEFGSTVR